MDNVKEDDEQVKAAIDQLAGDGCNIIFGISYGYLNAMEAGAEEYPDIIFRMLQETLPIQQTLTTILAESIRRDIWRVSQPDISHSLQRMTR